MRGPHGFVFGGHYLKLTAFGTSDARENGNIFHNVRRAASMNVSNEKGKV